MTSDYLQSELGSISDQLQIAMNLAIKIDLIGDEDEYDLRGAIANMQRVRASLRRMAEAERKRMVP